MVGGALDEALRKSIADGESDEPRKHLLEQWSLLAGPHTFRGRAAGLPANGDDSLDC